VYRADLTQCASGALSIQLTHLYQVKGLLGLRIDHCIPARVDAASASSRVPQLDGQLEVLAGLPPGLLGLVVTRCSTLGPASRPTGVGDRSRVYHLSILTKATHAYSAWPSSMGRQNEY